MNKKQVQNKIGIENWSVFSNWMRGQTVGITNGEINYYDYDVERFISYKFDPKNEPISDMD